MTKRYLGNTYPADPELALRTTPLAWTRSRLCDLSEWQFEELQRTAVEILGEQTAPAHRKVWEFAATDLARKTLGWSITKALAFH